MSEVLRNYIAIRDGLDILAMYASEPQRPDAGGTYDGISFGPVKVTEQSAKELTELGWTKEASPATQGWEFWCFAC